MIERKISVTAKENSRYNTGGSFDTMFGYVYISDVLNVAWGYDIDTSSEAYPEGDRTYVVFKIDVPEEQVEIDKDNERYSDIVSDCYKEDKHCYSINRDLILGEDVISVLCVKIRSYKKGCKYADDPQFDKKVINDWKKIIK